MGYSKGYNATYYCRICELSREECRLATEDDVKNHRTKESYTVALDKIETSYNVDIKDTKGIVDYCSLNNLKYFHILDNYTVDIMHDLCEGTIPFLLKNLFSYCIGIHLFTNESELRNYALFYDYGILNSKNIPSAICFERRNLGQNASQLKCLMQNVPYLFHDFKNDSRLHKVWVCVESMLKILQIVYSSKIAESDLIELEKAVSTHLKSIVQCFSGVNLLPKHHLMIHYANVIRAVGPLVHMSTMRYEMQHKTFTTYARRSNNFINITKSLAANFQKSILLKSPYQYEASYGKLREQKKFIEYYQSILQDTFGNFEPIFVTKWLKVNSVYYKSGILLKDNDNSLYQIDEIIFHDDFCFLCRKFEFVKFDPFLYSAEIQEVIPIKYHIVNQKNLLVRKSFVKIQLGTKFYIIADCLDIPNQ